MKTDIWMPVYIGDYLKATMGLDATGHGIYMLLLFEHWDKKYIVDDIDELMIIARVKETDRPLLIKILTKYFTKQDGKYIQKRNIKEKEAAENRVRTARENGSRPCAVGKKRGRPKTQKNPEKTDGFKIINPEHNPNINPEKTSSPLSSSSSLSIKDKSESDSIDKEFSAFWAAYPRKVQKKTAKDKYINLHKKKLLPKIEEHVRIIEQRKLTDQWKKDNGEFIPHPATWLNQERWNDEISSVKQEKPKTCIACGRTVVGKKQCPICGGDLK